MKLLKDVAKDIVNEDHEDYRQVTEEIVDQGRWDTHYEAVFKHIPSGKHYLVSYSRGSTEYQDSQEMFYDDEVDFIEVEETEVVVKQWVPILHIQ